MEDVTSGSERDGRVEQLLTGHPWLRSVGIGVGTFLIEYVVFALAFAVGPSSTNVDGIGDTAATYGHVLYNAHNVPTRTVVGNATMTASGNSNALYGATGGSVPPLLYFLIPVVALLAAGAVVGRERASPPGTSIVKASTDNAGELALGYLVAGIAGTFVFVRTATALGMTGTLSPSLPLTVGLFLVYPVLFGWVGSMAYLQWGAR